MSHPMNHAKSTAKKHGGKWEDYYEIHAFMDSSKSTLASWQHRALLHSSFGIFMVEKAFGPAVTNSDGKDVPTRVIAEQHVVEDLGWIPTVEDWLKNLQHQPWMTQGVQKKVGEIA